MQNKATHLLASLLLPLLVVIVALVTYQRYASEYRSTNRSTSIREMVTAPTIVSADDFHAALKHDVLILHLDVGWAIQAIESRPVVVEFKESLERDPRFASIQFRRIDCSDQEGPVWNALEDVLSRYGDTAFMIAGNGAVVWIRSGKVVDAVHSAAAEGIDRLIARTGMAMSTLRSEQSEERQPDRVEQTN